MEIERALHDNPHKKLLVRALELKHTNQIDSMLDAFLTELLLTGKFQSTSKSASDRNLVPLGQNKSIKVGYSESNIMLF